MKPKQTVMRIRSFTIKKGHHYCRWFWTKIFCPRWDHKRWFVQFVISSDNWIPFREGESSNKLYGVGFGLNHHKNSWRINWRYNFEKEGYFLLSAYTYDGGGNYVEEELGEIRGDKSYSVTVESINKKYWFTCLDIGAMISIPNDYPDYKLQFDLYPYHGGKLTAPKEEVFFIDFTPA